MGRFWQRQFSVWVAGLGCLLLLAAPLRPQHAEESALEVTTQERLVSEPWWPTMSTAPLKAYAGSATCTPCHSEGGQANGMTRAATRATDTTFLNLAHSVSVAAGSFRYGLTQGPKGLSLSASSGGKTLIQSMAWVIGDGELGRTFLYQAGGNWQQSRVSFYSKAPKLDVTTGLGQAVDPGLETALGQQLSAQDARSCFACHTVHATTSAGLEPLHAEAGLGCEACHGPAREHVSQMGGQAATRPAALHTGDAPMAGVFDPSRLSPEDSIDFCGACHRTSADARLSTGQAFGLAVVRFQPYRLQESKCWRATKDERLTCVACHNPHQPLVRGAAAYDGKCLQCHSGAATEHAALVCPKATTNCVSCHMPKVPVASMHGEFTDHFIRVARAGEPTPR